MPENYYHFPAWCITFTVVCPWTGLKQTDVQIFFFYFSEVCGLILSMGIY